MMFPASDTVPAGVPAFLGKLWILVDDPSNNNLIGWDHSGTSFHIYEQGHFAKEVLPYYFKHSNVASFIRQLNMYGFHKVSNVDQGSLKMEKDDMEFSHPYFVQGKKNLLVQIKRKIPMSKVEEQKAPVSELSHVLTEVHALQGKQKNMSSKLESLKTENGALWREVAMLRTKHHKQQQIVNKLIQFLVNLVGSSHGVPGRKRGLPMLSDVSDMQIATKMPRYSIEVVEVGNQQPPPYTVQLSRTPENVVTSPRDNVVIHELIDHSQMTSPVTITPGEPINSSSSQTMSTSIVDTPRVSTESSGLVDSVGSPLILSTMETTQPNFAPVITLDQPDMSSHDLPSITSEDLPDITPPDLTDMSPSYLDDVCAKVQAQCDAAPPSSLLLDSDCRCDDVASILKATQDDSECSGRKCNKVELSNHVDSLQTELELLKDLLAVSQYSVDTTTLTGLFAPEYPMTFNSDLLQHLDKECQLGSTLHTPTATEAGGSNADILPTPDISPSDTNTGGQELVQYTAGTDIQNLFDNVLDDTWYGGDHPVDHTTPTLDLHDCLNTPPVGLTINFPKSEPDLLDGNGTMTMEEID